MSEFQLIYIRLFNCLLYVQCSVTCGRGVIQRQVYCMIDDRVVAENNCRVEKKPKQTKRCKTIPCANWATKEWSKVSQYCNRNYVL